MLLNLDTGMQRRLVVIGEYGHRALSNDRSGVDTFINEMHRYAGHLYPMGESLGDRVDAGERGKKRRMNIDYPSGESLDCLRRQNPHEASQNHGLGACTLRCVGHRYRKVTPGLKVAPGDDRGLDSGAPGSFQGPNPGLVRNDHPDPRSNLRSVDEGLKVGSRS